MPLSVPSTSNHVKHEEIHWVKIFPHSLVFLSKDRPSNDGNVLTWPSQIIPSRLKQVICLRQLVDTILGHYSTTVFLAQNIFSSSFPHASECKSSLHVSCKHFEYKSALCPILTEKIIQKFETVSRI